MCVFVERWLIVYGNYILVISSEEAKFCRFLPTARHLVIRANRRCIPGLRYYFGKFRELLHTVITCLVSLLLARGQGVPASAR